MATVDFGEGIYGTRAQGASLIMPWRSEDEVDHAAGGASLVRMRSITGRPGMETVTGEGGTLDCITAWRPHSAAAAMLRAAAITPRIIATLAALSGTATTAGADDDMWWIKPAIQIGGHAQTGGGVLPGSGLSPRDQSGGVAAAFSLLAPVRPRLHVGLAGELTAARTVLDHQTVIGPQTYNIASVRSMARLEMWSRPPFDRAGHGSNYYALLGAGWNFNAAGTGITYLAGAPAGTAGKLRVSHRPAFELGGGLELRRKRDGIFFVEASWLWNRGPYRLQVFGESDRMGTFDLSGVTLLLGLRFNPPALPGDEGP